MGRERRLPKAERKSRRKRGQRAVRPRAAGKRIRDDAHLMPAGSLLARKVEHMAKEAANRSPQHVDNPQSPHGVESALRKIANRIFARSALGLSKIDRVLSVFKRSVI